MSCETCKDWGRTIEAHECAPYYPVPCSDCGRLTYPNLGVNLPAGCAFTFAASNGLHMMRAHGVAKESDWPYAESRAQPVLSQERSTMRPKKVYTIKGLASHNIVKTSFGVAGRQMNLSRKRRKAMVKNAEKIRHAIVKSMDEAPVSVSVGGSDGGV